MSAAPAARAPGVRVPRPRRRLDALLAAAVVAVAAVAAWDALRVVPEPDPPADGLRALGAAGELLVSDERCVRRRLALPTLELTEVRRIVGCDVFGHRGSLGIVRGEVGWYAYPGRGGSTMLLTTGQAERATGDVDARVIAAAWLENTRFAALVERPGSEARLLALFERDRLVRRVAELARGYAELRSSPRGGWFAALDADGRLELFDREGRAVTLPDEVERPHAIAWSRDERVAAVADRRGLLLFPPGRPEPQSVRLALRVVDLAWRR